MKTPLEFVNFFAPYFAKLTPAERRFIAKVIAPADQQPDGKSTG